MGTMNKKLKVLIVEDNESLLLLLSHYLSKNYEVHSSKNGLDAMSIMSHGLFPDLILLDWDMPVMDGKRFLEGVQLSSIYQSIPIIIISGSNDYLEESAKGIAYSFCKPFDPKVLKQKIIEMLEHKNSIIQN